MKTVLLVFALVFLTACSSLSRYSSQQEDIDTITYMAVVDWHEKLRNPAISYHFDESEGRYSRAVVERLKKEIPEFRSSGEGSRFVELSPVQFKEGGFAYIELRAGDGFYSQKYVQVFRKTQGSWAIIDRFALHGDDPPWLQQFDWNDYLKELQKKGSNQSAQTTPRGCAPLRV